MANPNPLLNDATVDPVPTHVAIIMDGSGRWAGKRNLTRLDGHRAGTENIRRVIETFAKNHVKYLTLYAFSTENWKRPEAEVDGLMQILNQMIKRETEALHQKGVKLCHIGVQNRLSEELQQQIKYAVELTKNNTGMTLSLAFDYGGRAEIVNAVKQIIEDKISPASISEDLIETYLYTSKLPDPDLIIRTGGEMRLSNFLLWQSAYSEFYSTPVPWPDFDEEEINKALVAFSKRERFFGGWRK